MIPGLQTGASYAGPTLCAFPYANPQPDVADEWNGSARLQECGLHQIAPFIGKMKSSMARTLVKTFTSPGETIYDPFSGSGTVALEAWIAGRNVIANDWSPYAFALTRAKLFPCPSLEQALAEVDLISRAAHTMASTVDLRTVPAWVRAFFHPRTLRETIAWAKVLRTQKAYFVLACLLGILHHQRPGFLSFPSSHTVPYLREKRFPRADYPELYEYRPVRERLERKIARALERLPKVDFELTRQCYQEDAARRGPSRSVSAIITSPPYMRQLDYGRDNRLRLWFLGCPDWRKLDSLVTPSEDAFIRLLRSCLELWRAVLVQGGTCVLVLGDTRSRRYGLPLADAVVQLATREVGGYAMLWRHTEPIPSVRRVRRACCGNSSETVLVLRKETGA